MTEIIYNQAKTCAITGHRNMSDNPEDLGLERVFINLIEDGYDTFLVGMALGFDTLSFKTLLGLREKYSIKIVACVPFMGQPNKFTSDQQKEYYEMLNTADFKVILSENYTPNCMRKRNDYMVDNSSAIVVYLRHNFGGTYYTYNYAKRKNLKIINV